MQSSLHIVRAGAAHLISMQIKIVLLIIGRNKTAFSASKLAPSTDNSGPFWFAELSHTHTCLPALYIYIYGIWFFDPTYSLRLKLLPLDKREKKQVEE